MGEKINRIIHAGRLSLLDEEFRDILAMRRGRKRKQSDYMIVSGDRMCKIRDEYDSLIGRVDASEELLDKYSYLL